jgi:ABC-2 type transport system permease protein
VNRRAILAIMRKDLKVVIQNQGVLLPMILLPALFLVVFPVGLCVVVQFAVGSPDMPLSDISSLILNMPSGLQAELSGYNDAQRLVVLALVYFLAPMFLILPLMVASVISADSFAGEKERKTLEALLYTPTSDRELYVGKVLTAWVPAVIVAVGGALLYAIVVNGAAWPVMGRIFFPNLAWIALTLWVSPAVAGLGLGATVLVSARAKSFQDASGIAGAVVVPVIALMGAQATGLMYFSLTMVLLLGLFFWIVVAVLLWFGGKTFRRSELIAQV